MTAVFRETFISLYNERVKSLKLPTVVYDIINTCLYSIVYTYIECVFMCNLFARFLLNFCGSATFRNGKEEKTFHHRFLLPQSKNTYSRKGLNTPTPKTRYLLYSSSENKSSRNFDFYNVYFLFASCFNKIFFNL